MMRSLIFLPSTVLQQASINNFMHLKTMPTLNESEVIELIASVGFASFATQTLIVDSSPLVSEKQQWVSLLLSSYW